LSYALAASIVSVSDSLDEIGSHHCRSMMCAHVTTHCILMKSSVCALFFDGGLGIGNSLWASLRGLLRTAFWSVSSISRFLRMHFECDNNV